MDVYLCITEYIYYENQPKVKIIEIKKNNTVLYNYVLTKYFKFT